MKFDPIKGPIPNDWRHTTIGMICTEGAGNVQTGPFGSQLHASDYVSTGIPLIMPKNLKEDRVSIDGVAKISSGDAGRLFKHKLLPGDIVYSRRGDVERRALITTREKGWVCGTGCLRIRIQNPKVNDRYVYYYLGHPSVRRYIVSHAHGTTMANLNTKILSDVPVVVPPLDEQRRIAYVLGTLDDKIELNRQMNATLEAIAQAIFKSWFVDFDGHDDLVESDELGLIPRGWEVRTIKDVVKSVGGATPRTKTPEYWAEGDICWTTPKDLSSAEAPVLLDTTRKITEAGLSKISSGLLPVGTLLMSSRAPVGYLALTRIPTAINQGYIAMLPGGRLSPLFLLHWAHFNMDVIKSRAGGTTFAEISKRNFRPIPIAVPSKDVLDKFETTVSPMFEKMVANLEQSQTLTELRDTLLPKLISGELRVPEALEIADEVIEESAGEVEQLKLGL